MINDPLARAAYQRAVSLSADIEIQLGQKAGGAPVVALLVKAREAAANAIVKLAEVDPYNAKAVCALQNEITCFDRICEWIKEIVRDGFEAGAILDEDGREDLADAVGLSQDDAEDVIRRGPFQDEDQ